VKVLSFCLLRRVYRCGDQSHTISGLHKCKQWAGTRALQKRCDVSKMTSRNMQSVWSENPESRRKPVLIYAIIINNLRMRDFVQLREIG